MKEKIIALVSDRRFQVAVALIAILIIQALVGGITPAEVMP